MLTGYEPKQQDFITPHHQVQWGQLPVMGVQDGNVTERKRLVGRRGGRCFNQPRQQEQVSKSPQCDSAAPGRFPAATCGTLEVSEASLKHASQFEQYE